MNSRDVAHEASNAAPSEPVLSVLAHLRSDVLPGLMLRAPLAGGSNDVWAAGFDNSADGRRGAARLVVKVYTHAWEQPAAVQSHEAASLAAWSRTGVVPFLVAAGQDPVPWLVTELADGAHPDPWLAPSLTSRVTEALAKLHCTESTSTRGAAHEWPRFDAGWISHTPFRLRELAGPNHEQAAAVAERALTVLSYEPEVLIHGDVAPWNVLTALDGGRVTLLDPLARLGPAVFDLARWCVTSALTRLWCDGLLGGAGVLLEELPRNAQTALRSYRADLNPVMLREATVLELLNRASFTDWRWPTGYAGILTAVALAMTGGAAHDGYMGTFA